MYHTTCRNCNKGFDTKDEYTKCCSPACDEQLGFKEACGIPGAPQGIRDAILASTPEQWTPKQQYLGGTGGRGYAFPLVRDKNVWIEFDHSDGLSFAGFYVKQYNNKYGGPDFGYIIHHDGIAFNPHEFNHNPCLTYGKTTDLCEKFREIDAHYNNTKKSKIQKIEDDFKDMLKERFG